MSVRQGVFGSFLLTASTGALVTVAGIYMGRKLKAYFSRKPKMRLAQQNLCLSTRCTWLISELRAESAFELTDDDLYPGLSYPEDTDRDDKQLMLEHSFNVQARQEQERKDTEAKNQLVRFGCRSSDQTLSGEFGRDMSDYEPPRGLLQGGGQSIPALILNDEFTMIEGAAICMYLADLYGRFLPEEENKAEYYSWIVYSASTFDNIIKNLQQQLVDTTEADRNHVVLDSAERGFHAFARALSECLENREYLCGNSFTAADCVLGFTLWWAYTIQHGRLLERYPALVAYLERLKKRPAFRKTFCGDEEWDWSRYFTACVSSHRS